MDTLGGRAPESLSFPLLQPEARGRYSMGAGSDSRTCYYGRCCVGRDDGDAGRAVEHYAGNGGGGGGGDGGHAVEHHAGVAWRAVDHGAGVEGVGAVVVRAVDTGAGNGGGDGVDWRAVDHGAGVGDGGGGSDGGHSVEHYAGVGGGDGVAGRAAKYGAGIGRCDGDGGPAVEHLAGISDGDGVAGRSVKHGAVVGGGDGVVGRAVEQHYAGVGDGGGAGFVDHFAGVEGAGAVVVRTVDHGAGNGGGDGVAWRAVNHGAGAVVVRTVDHGAGNGGGDGVAWRAVDHGAGVGDGGGDSDGGHSVEHYAGVGGGDGVAGRAVKHGAGIGDGDGVAGRAVVRGAGVGDGGGGGFVDRSVEYGAGHGVAEHVMQNEGGLENLSPGAKRKRDENSFAGSGFACGGHNTSKAFKQPKRSDEPVDLEEDADDLLHYLDVTYKLENAVDSVATDPVGICIGEHDNDFDVPEIALLAMTTVKRRMIEHDDECDPVDDTDSMETDEDDDILRHLDVAYKLENAGQSSPCCEKEGCKSEIASRDVDVKGIAAFALAVAKYSDSLVARQTVYRCSKSNNDVDGVDDAESEQHLLRHIQEIGDHRCSHTQGEQARRRQHARKRYRDQKEAARRTHDQFGPISEDDRAEALTRLQKALGPEGLEECVCVACDELVLRQDAARKEASDWRFMSQMRRCLGEVDSALPRSLVDSYAAPACVTYLSNVMVAPKSFRCYTDSAGHPTAWFTVCSACLKAIKRACMPKFAIANGFFIGKLPDTLTDLTLPERFMTQLVSISAMTRVMRGGRHRCIRSHCVAFDCTPGPPVSLLPTSISDVSGFRVAMVGDFTEAQLDKVKKLHQIRTSKLRDVYDFYTRNNSLYSHVVRNDSALLGDMDYDRLAHLLLEHIEDEDGVADSSVREELENIRGHSDAWQVNGEDDELSIVERRIALSDAVKECTARGENADTECNEPKQGSRTFLVKRSNQIALDVSGDLLAKMFPHLFPYGCGHPGQSRQIPVSFKECVKHYTLLSGRQFSHDELFTLIAFDRISLTNMYTQNSMRCQRFPSVFCGFESIGSPELEKALLENEQRIQGQRSSRLEQESLAHKFLKSVEVASSAVWGSNAERAKCRQKAFAYQLRFGQPALFITLTPNTDNSLAMAHYAGISSVKSLFDILEAPLPTKAELREASLSNDCASTRLFMRNVDAFVENVLGMNPVTQERMPFRGLIGGVEAYFGMVETQGRGTLHIHMLIWLKGVPTSTVELEAKLSGPNGGVFQQTIEAYIQSIVTNNLPLPVERCSCVRCGAPYSNLIGLDIPQHARQHPHHGIYSAKRQASVVEPALVRCGSCDTKLSSQHVLRRVLLQARPMHWPPWLRDLTAAEIDDQAGEELVARDSFGQAVDAINEREKAQLSLRNVCESFRDRFGLTTTPDTDNLEEANALQMGAHKSDDDPFQNDPLTRRIEALPPMVSDGRMGTFWMDYMVSSLVIQLNQHWWNHTTSCFKTSKATVNDSFCRYLFPRDRSPRTTFDQTGAHLERKLAHEYINGFNYQIMAAFKCNHDIQVLLGGRDAAERIFYCTKYVTKQQKQLDSVVVMALASFHRRQERELQAESDGQVQSSEWLTKARKRVASMVYSMTSRQEIAGPLAALYLYRGSCCYESSRCSYVPLHDVLHQLRSTEEYSCALVDESSSSEPSRFLAVSFLDDYIFRPDKLEHISIYEFAMRYFWKKDDHALTATLPFKQQHPLNSSYSLGKRYKELVPVIQGFRLPFVTESSPKSIRYKRAVLALVLFKPFRALADLTGLGVDCEDLWIDSYAQWEATRSDFVVKIMRHVDEYYYGEDRAKSRADEAMTEAGSGTASREFRDSSESDEDSDDQLFDACEHDDADNGDASMSDEFRDPWDPEADASCIIDTQELDPVKCPTSAKPDRRVDEILRVFKTYNMLEGSALHTVSRPQATKLQSEFPTVHDMRKWVQDSETDNKLCETMPETVVARVTEVRELLEEASEEVSMAWWNSAAGTSLNHHNRAKFANICQISRDFTLNEKQHYAFKLIGKALLMRWRKVEDLTYVESGSHNALHEDQLRFFLGGEGGTGKTRVLDAVQALCDSWNRADCLIKTALTGKAATLISGRTLASFLLQLKKKRRKSSIYLDILVIDEVSMMKKYQLAQLDKLLRSAKRVPTVPLGSIHVVLVGDFLQLPPVGGDPLYKRPSGRRVQNANENAGYALWITFDCVIMLDESVRFKADPEWGRGCKNARLGVWLPEFVDLINSRVMDPSRILDGNQPEELPSFITPDNSTRLSINNLFVATVASAMPEGEYPVRIVADFKGHLAKLGKSEVATIMCLPDTKFGRMAPYLDLIVGMPIQLTQNVRATKMAANGTLGTLEEIIYQPGTTFCVVYDNVGGFAVKLPSSPPAALIVRIRRGASAVAMRGCTDSDLFPLFSDARPYNQCEIKLAPTPLGVPRCLSVRIEQFPIVCAISSTVYKVQGETLGNMVVTEWRSQSRIANKREQPYLLVSRVTSRHAFRTLSLLTADITSWAHPAKETLDEEERLQQLSAKMLRHLETH